MTDTTRTFQTELGNTTYVREGVEAVQIASVDAKRTEHFNQALKLGGWGWILSWGGLICPLIVCWIYGHLGL